MLRLVPEGHQEDWEHFLSEARFALGIVCHADPGSQFDLPSAEPRLKRFQIWLIETWPSFIQPKQKIVPAKGSEGLDQNPSSSSGVPRKTLFRE